jgi:hypothetical protein
VTPSVEVKRPEVADAVSPDDLGPNDEEPGTKPPQQNEKHDVTPESKPAEDVQMKKALELLRENKPVAAQKAA